ncbi:guanylate kinase [Clostridium sp. AM58-1XD]|uniref:guanylate kinase n=1 Tax=Clostridium sp. AM58-1XD TaxID=2292307 RepID=UPI000E4FB8D5|nr:guanylate kinase [Clostridium sp. AM58-1XD]RGY95014.1 guanylate kinase [Clostridium sp. AM58-1XD]
MGRIFYVMGKSASGKDTVYKRILKDMPELKTVVIYTTRPVRDGEQNGVEYYFTSEEKLREYERSGKVIESRTYSTVYGPWTYFTVDDGQFDLKSCNYLMIGTLESYGNLRRYFGGDAVVPVYIYVDDGLRLVRALERERVQKNPKYAEMCRRFLADEEDFKEENLKAYGIERQFVNSCLEECVREIEGVIKGNDSIHG